MGKNKAKFKLGDNVIVKHNYLTHSSRGIGVIVQIIEPIYNKHVLYTVRFKKCMMSFYEYKLEHIDLPNSSEHTIEYKPNINQIYGRSNTGKSSAAIMLGRAWCSVTRIFEEENKMELKNIKKENLDEAKKQYDEEKDNAEINYAKNELNIAQDEINRIDREIKALEAEKKIHKEIISFFKTNK